ncbi:MAG: nicotinate-nucleotide adenylyltransferase [Alphaproteobacteria bacterium]|nr:nicotinate-nucleotide adenylyltransferase [Alphaproteobacteria bacterium]
MPERSAAPINAPQPRRRIGLLGGSFNPAHQGHRKLSVLALKRLRLDQVWWLVSPQNPLKSSFGMAPLAERLRAARKLATHPRIRVTDLERRLGTRYTVDTLSALRRRCRDQRFVWLMGADNLVQLRHWYRWTRIFALASVAVFDRPGETWRALASLPARRFRHRRVAAARSGSLASRRLPAWTLLHGVNDPTSATALRARQHAR